MLEDFTLPWRKWAHDKDARIRNQAHGSPGNLLDLYAASDIPETETSSKPFMKMASSAAHIAGNKLTSAESCVWLNEHFISTLSDARATLDNFFLSGGNHVIYHGTTFSPPAETWPGWIFYASVHFGPTNPIWNDFPALNRYVARSQSFLQSGLMGPVTIIPVDFFNPAGPGTTKGRLANGFNRLMLLLSSS